MTDEDPQYVIFVDDEESESSAMYSAPLHDGDRKYFLEGIVPALRPLSDDDYLHGPAVILQTLAKFSYILYRGDLYWCAEWEPGLIVVRFTPQGSMAWAALRSPIPEFGGRRADPEDLRGYDEEAENPQYNLVFNAWDAQFDEEDRQWQSFSPASEETERQYETALAHVQQLSRQLEARYSGEGFEAWAERCTANLKAWAGTGVRVRVD